ncbi:MAG: EI24 domain-containing protein [Campylobacterota bacterium]
MNQNLWSISVQDFFTKKMLTYAFAPFLFTVIVLYALFFSAADAGLDSMQESFVQIESMQTTQENGITHTESSNVVYSGGNAIMEFLMAYSLTSWLVSFFVFTVGGMFMFVIAIFTAILVIGFLTPAIMRELQARHYPEVELEGHGNVITTLFHSLKYVAIMFVLLIVLIPFYFIPLVNIVAINLPFYYLFHKFYLLDVGTTALTKEQFKQMMFFQGNKVRMNTVVLYVISMIPFAALITPVFNVIVLSHTVLRNKQTRLEAPTQA